MRAAGEGGAPATTGVGLTRDDIPWRRVAQERQTRVGRTMGRRKAAPPPGYVRRFRDVLASPLGHVLVRATGAALLILLGGLVMRQARAQAYAMPQYRLTPGRIQLQGLPRWVDASIRAELLDGRYYRRFSTSVFDPDAEANVRAIVAAHPLVQSVQHVNVRYPRSVTVKPILRIPVAQVTVVVVDRRGKRHGMRRLLGHDGSLLPLAPYAAYRKRLRVPLPVVVGIRATAVERIGGIWEDRSGQVAEAVAAAEVARRIFRDTGGRVHIRQIDVSRFPSSGDDLTRGEISLRAILHPVRANAAKGEFRIEWGRTERDCRDAPREDCYEKKLSRLRRAIEHPTRRRLLVDVRFPDARD